MEADMISDVKILRSLRRLSSILQQNEPLEVFWICLSDALATVFTHTSCTVLYYDRPANTLQRLHSSRPDVHRIGGRKGVTDSFWSRKVLDKGEILIGSTRDDIKAYFSEYENLWANGWESILNIPVKQEGKTIGSINIMNGAGAYDNVDIENATIFAQLAVIAIQRAAETGTTVDDGNQPLVYV